MYALSKMRLLLHMLNWRLRWGSQDIHYPAPALDNPKFISPSAAAALIPDGSVIATSGLAANQWAAILHWAIRESFKNTGHPRNLTVVAIGGQGARGRVPGSLEELGLEGLCTRFFGGHLETFKSFLRLADAGKLELQCIPQGVLAHLIDGQGRGEDSYLTEVGVGTFADPRTGRGTPLLTDQQHEQWVSVEGDRLRFRLPRINVAMFNAPAADRHGNIYLKHSALIAETFEIIRAARKNGGRVIANVGLLVDEGYDRIAVPAEDVDAVVYYSGTEQVASVPHRDYMPVFTTRSNMPREKGIALLRFANQILRITPVRRPIDAVLARLAASIFAEHAPRGSLVNIGVGLPEEVCRVICEAGLYDDIKLFTESGVIGGLPAPGVFFGTAVCPERMISSVNTFNMCAKRLDVSILGVLQADSEGNVNVSKRGEGAVNYVGPGGFIDFSTSARTIIFVTSWMFQGKIRIKNDRLHLVEQGRIKFVDKVDEITFSGRQAVRNGRKVFFVTNVGVFRLTEAGMMLMCVMPGINIEQDILRTCSMRIVLPESAPPVVAASIVTGENFRLRLKESSDSEETTEPWAEQTGFSL